MKKKVANLFLLFFVVIIFFISSVSSTQTYLNESEQWQQNLSRGIYSALAWGDIDSDGDTDLILTKGGPLPNTQFSKIYINNGTTLNENQTWQQNLTAVRYGSLSLGDIDNDGDLDLASSGCNGDARYVRSCDSGNISTKIYINNGTTFTESSIWQDNLTAVYQPGSLTFADIDNDGDLDLGLTGSTGSSRISKIYINNGTSLVESSQWQTNLEGMRQSSLAFGDYDNDGDLDLILSGRDNSNNKLTKAYVNNGTSFVESSQWQGDLLNVDDSSLAFADFDNDGDLDLSLTGCCDHHIIYKNNGTSFVETQEAELGSVFAGSQAFGDYDNDGYLDLIVNGREKETSLHLYNISSTNFTSAFLDPESHIAEVDYGSLAWIDLDDDTDLDLIEIGYDTQSNAYVYTNNRSLTKNNSQSSPPNIFTSSYSDGVLNLTWNNGSDPETTSKGLYYNLMIGNSTDNHTIVSGIYGGSSNPTAGYFGNMMQRKNISINKYLADDTYYWYVQTIDTGLRKSNWSDRQSITIGSDTSPPNISSVSSSVTHSTATITWTTNESANSTVYYGTTNSTTSNSSLNDLVIAHSIILSELSASTLYYYNVSSCDYWNNCNTSIQYNFTTSAAPVTPPPGGGSSGGSSTTPTIITPVIPEFYMDFSILDSGIFEVEQGDIKTFTFQGEVEHSITPITITSNSATLIIASDPIIIQILLGETIPIDINKDEINDLEITLNSITNGKANFLITKLEGADIVGEEELGKEPLFDVKISLSNLFSVVKSGGEIIASIEVLNINNIGQVDVLVEYYITDMENNTLTQGSDTLAVEAVASFVRTLTVPYNLKSGKYLFNADISYAGEVMASGNAEFRVIKSYWIIIVIGVFVLIVAGIFFYLWRIGKREEKTVGKIKRREMKLERRVKLLEGSKNKKKRGKKK
jgi:hypothetical protein